jgi:RNA polymerase sigma-70 factor (ECF subfamily)
MHEFAARLAGPLVRAEEELAREFEARLSDSSTLAFRVAFSVLRHRQDAEDVAQEAFVRAYRGFRRLRERDRFRAWLVRMTWRLALDWKRGASRRVAREQAAIEVAPGETSEDVAIASERSARLWEAIDALPPKLRLVIVLGSIEGHGLGEVAALLGIPQGTVKSRMFEARKRLGERLR